jgi:hypothetical protein
MYYSSFFKFFFVLLLLTICEFFPIILLFNLFSSLIDFRQNHILAQERKNIVFFPDFPKKKRRKVFMK